MTRLALAFLLLFLLGGATGCAGGRLRHGERSGLLDRRVAVAERKKASEQKMQDSQRLKQLRAQASAWTWPLEQVSVTSSFGRRGRDFHEGVDLRAPLGTSVYSAEHGVVVYAGQKIRGYGKMVIIKHPSGLSTVYAHNSRLLVKRGQRVQRGRQIAFSGNTGQSTGPHLHFEVRDGIASVDPLRILPGPRPGTLAQRPKKPARRLASYHEENRR